MGIVPRKIYFLLTEFVSFCESLLNAPATLEVRGIPAYFLQTLASRKTIVDTCSMIRAFGTFFRKLFL